MKRTYAVFLAAMWLIAILGAWAVFDGMASYPTKTWVITFGHFGSLVTQR